MRIEDYQKCQCGAVTLFFEEGGSNSVRLENLEKITGISPEDLEVRFVKLPQSYCCNHCINHYGLDICACGSGQDPKQCDSGIENVCGVPYETLGTPVPFKPKFYEL